MIPPFVTPVIPVSDFFEAAAVWGDVVVVNPWNYNRAFGDLEMLAEQYDSARAWIDIGVSRNEAGLWNRTSWQFGDWLDPKSPYEHPSQATTHRNLVADFYLLHSMDLIANISSLLGDEKAAERYRQNRSGLTREFRNAWVSDNSTLANRTQTAYALAVDFDIFQNTEDTNEAGLVLRDIIAENDYLVGTGFAGTPILGHALSKVVGGVDDFYKMLLQTQVPSWLCQVAMNATTTWERRDSLQPNGTVAPGGMTSFSKLLLDNRLIV